MSMEIQENILRYKFVQEEFEDVGECLKDELSSVQVSLTKDVHTDSVDLEICIYGKEYESDAFPIVQYVQSMFGEVVVPNLLLSLFDQELLELFIDSGTKIHWNQGDLTYKQIDPVAHNNIGFLFAQEH